MGSLSGSKNNKVCGITTAADLDPKDLNLRAGESNILPVYRKNLDTNTPSNCVGWEISAKVMFDGASVFEVPIQFTDAAQGIASMTITAENLGKLPRDVGGYLEILYAPPTNAGSTSVTRVNLVRYL